MNIPTTQQLKSNMSPDALKSHMSPDALKSRISSLNKGNYPYVTARVKGKKRSLLTEDSYPKLMKMGSSQIARLLGEATYHKEMVELARTYSGNELIERALNMNLARTYREILDFSKGELKLILEIYLDWWNVYNIKIILRSLHHNLSSEEVKEYIVPAGSLDRRFLESLIEHETAEEVISTLREHGYRTPPNEYIENLHEKGHGLRPIEDYYDRSYYAALLESARGRSKPMQIYRNYIKRSIDVVNARNLMEMVLEKVEPVKIESYMLSGGAVFSMEKLCEMSAKEPEDALQDIKDALGTDLDNIDAASANIISIQLDRYIMDKSEKLSHIHPLSIIPIIDFIIRKEKETRYIRIIVKGKEHSLPEDRMRGLLGI